MSTIVQRLVKGSPLTYQEMDSNFVNLNTDKTENTAFNAHLASTSAHPAVDIPITDAGNHYVATNVEDALAEAYTGIRAYADSLVVGLLDDRGNYDASINLFPSTGGSGTAGAILKGDLWYITVAGTLGGVYIAVGDTIRALVDSPGQIATNWATMEKGGLALQYFTEGRNITAPNATVPVHSFTPLGTEPNIDAVFSSKGTGAIAAQIADGTATGGNKRGANAVDWQTTRAVASYVASGGNSIICGGGNNISNASYSIVVGGSGNIAQNTYSAVVGGNINNAVGLASFVGGGTSNYAGGSYSVVGGGTGNNASGDYSTVLGGLSGFTRGLYGRYSYASGLFSTLGDAQIGYNVQRYATTDATVTSLTADGTTAAAANISVLPDNTAYTTIAHITARNTSTGDMASWKIEGAVKRGTGAATTVLVGTPAITTIAKDAGASTWAVAMVANTTRGSVEIQVTGGAATTIHWVCKLDTVEVG